MIIYLLHRSLQFLLLDLRPFSPALMKKLAPLSCVFVFSLKPLSFLHSQTIVSLSILLQCQAQLVAIFLICYKFSYIIIASLLSIQILVIMMSSPYSTILLWLSPLTPLLIDSVLKSTSPMIELLRAQRDLISVLL